MSCRVKAERRGTHRARVNGLKSSGRAYGDCALGIEQQVIHGSKERIGARRLVGEFRNGQCHVLSWRRGDEALARARAEADLTRRIASVAIQVGSSEFKSL